MSKTVELHAEIVENDAGDIVMRLRDYGKGAITFHRASGAKAEGDPRPGATEADPGQPALGASHVRLRLGHGATGYVKAGAGRGFVALTRATRAWSHDSER
jgi:hypothetical protein